MTVDTLGLVLRVLVTAANVGEREGGKQVLQRVKQSKGQVSRLTTLWVDGGFGGEAFMHWVMDVCRWIVQVVLRPERSLGLCVAQKTLGSRAHLREC
jgi:transposase